MKKAQVTVFIIIGVVILLIGILVFSFRHQILESSIAKKLLGTSAAKERISLEKEKISRCIENVIIEDIYEIGENGGYSRLIVGPSLMYLNISYRYLVYNSESLLPTKEDLINELEKTINFDINTRCPLEIVPEDGTEIKYGIGVVNLDLSKGIAKAVVEWPIDITALNLTQRVDKFEFEYEIDLEKYLNITEDIIKTDLAYMPSVCLTCIAKIGDANNVEITISHHDNNVVYTVIDNTLERPYYFAFASQH